MPILPFPHPQRFECYKASHAELCDLVHQRAVTTRLLAAWEQTIAAPMRVATKRKRAVVATVFFDGPAGADPAAQVEEELKRAQRMQRVEKRSKALERFDELAAEEKANDKPSAALRQMAMRCIKPWPSLVSA